MAKLHVFEVGYCTHPACIAVRGAGIAPRKFPARAYLIETRQGCYLWDTGYSQHFEEFARGIYAPYKWVTPVSYDDNTDCLLAQLSAIGLGPSDLRGILLSHYHADHVAGLRDFPSVPLWSSPEALASIKGLRGLRALLQAFIPELLPIDFDARISTFSSAQWRPLPGALSPFQHGWYMPESDELIVVPLPGHAAGHIGAFVQTDSGWVLLASDAAWATAGYESLVGPSEIAFLVQDNRAAYYETLKKLHAIHLRGIPIFLSHA